MAATTLHSTHVEGYTDRDKLARMQPRRTTTTSMCVDLQAICILLLRSALQIQEEGK